MSLNALRQAVGRVVRVAPTAAVCSGRAVVIMARAASSDASKYTHIKVSRVGTGEKVGLITLNRPKGKCVSNLAPPSITTKHAAELVLCTDPTLLILPMKHHGFELRACVHVSVSVDARGASERERERFLG